jgi:hypothetical protein
MSRERVSEPFDRVNKFEQGKEVSGLYLGWYDDIIIDGKERPVILLQGGGGEIEGFWGGEGLKKYTEKIQHGEFVFITLLEKVVLKSGQTFNRFKVEKETSTTTKKEGKK